MDEIALTIDEAARVARTGRTKLYEEIAAGRLVVARVGRKTLVPTHRLRQWLAACEQRPAVDQEIAGKRGGR